MKMYLIMLILAISISPFPERAQAHPVNPVPKMVASDYTSVSDDYTLAELIVAAEECGFSIVVVSHAQTSHELNPIASPFIPVERLDYRPPPWLIEGSLCDKIPNKNKRPSIYTKHSNRHSYPLKDSFKRCRWARKL